MRTMTHTKDEDFIPGEGEFFCDISSFFWAGVGCDVVKTTLNPRRDAMIHDTCG